MISNYLKEYFKNKNISQYEIERKTGITQCKINLSLNGKRRLTADELIKIAIVFNIDLNETKKEIISQMISKRLASPNMILKSVNR